MKKSRFDYLKRDFSFDDIKSKLEFWCAYQDRSTFEVENKLHEYSNLSETQRNLLIDSLIDNNFLNENRFVESFISGKINIKKWGKIKIKYHLISKKIPLLLANQHLKKIDNELYQKNLIALLKRKNEQLLVKYPDKYLRATKISNYLISKGYEIDLIVKEINNSILTKD